MIRFLLLAVLILLVARTFWRLVDGVVDGAAGSSRQRRGIRRSVKLIKDPVCGTFVAPQAQLAVTRDGETHYFCSDACRRKFMQA